MIQLQESDRGVEFHSENFFGLFGAKNSSVDVLRTSYPDFNFVRIRQTHSDIVLESDLQSEQVRRVNTKSYQELPEADAHFTGQPKLALCVSTADCMPIMIYCHRTKRVAAIHAGWRGVANRIVPKTIQKFISSGSTSMDLLIIIGPHILKPSFQIQDDVRKQLMLSSAQSESNLFSGNADSSFQFDLHQLMLLQIAEFEVPSENLSSLLLDTKTDLRFHSFRRDQQNSGRQISFISLL